MAIASLVCGIASFVVCLGPITGVAALITGYKGRNEIDASGGVQDGRGMAVAGIILGWIAIALSAIGIGVIILAALFGEPSDPDDIDSFSMALRLIAQR